MRRGGKGEEEREGDGGGKAGEKDREKDEGDVLGG